LSQHARTERALIYCQRHEQWTYCFCDRDTFSFASTDTPNKIILYQQNSNGTYTDFGVEGMPETKDCAEDVNDIVNCFFARFVVDALMGSSQFSTEGQGLANRKMGKVDIHFSIVGNLASKPVMHDLRWNAIVVDI
jgi:hypothetical protein